MTAHAAYTAASTRLHWMLDTHGEDVALRNIADDLECSGAIGPALTFASYQAHHAALGDREFWRRLAGSLRKAETVARNE